MIADTGLAYTGGTHYKESTRHYYEIAHQAYLRALEEDIHVMEGVGR